MLAFCNTEFCFLKMHAGCPITTYKVASILKCGGFYAMFHCFFGCCFSVAWAGHLGLGFSKSWDTRFAVVAVA
jgi:hypothetical protein